MNTKEKAQELVDKFKDYVHGTRPYESILEDCLDYNRVIKRMLKVKADTLPAVLP
jgi:hypothetical protein